MTNFTDLLLLAEGPAGAISYEARRVLLPILMILMVMCSIALVVIVLMQKSTGDNMSAIAGGSNSDSFYGKNKSQTREGMLKKATIGLAASLLVVSIVFFIISAN